MRAPGDLHADQFAAYRYLLGTYLGDGSIGRTPKTYRFHVSSHQRQQRVIERVVEAITVLRPGRPVGLRHRGRVAIVNANSNTWPTLFPQHGAGRKHPRPIALEAWQRSIVERHPWEFVRGCIESDGCRHRRIVAGRNDPAYSFRSHSEDILHLFVWPCGRIDLRSRRANRVTVSIARRADVARVDGILGDGGVGDSLAATTN